MSDDIVIRVEDISKRYRISHLAGQGTLRDTVHHAARLAWRRVRWKTRLEREDFWALRDINFEIKRGEVVGIIGRNGAGKSTLLKILSRITEPTTGRITIKGRVASLLEVGTGFHPELTGRDNIFLNGAILGMKRAEIRAKFDEIVAFAEVERFIDTPVKRYSSGMYVRLAFAVAAHLEPEILIVDEVLAVGDVAFQKKCLGKLQDITRSEGRTVLFVSHNMNAIKNLCTRTAWLHGGRLRTIEATESCMAAYLAPAQTEKKAEVDSSTITASRIGDGRARVTCLRLLAMNETPCSEFMLGEPFLIEATVKVAEPMTSYLIGFHVATTDQQVVFCSNHHDSLASQTLQPGSHTFRCRVAGLALAPGEYSLTYAISASVGGICHDALMDALNFSVQPIIHNATPATANYLDGRPGLVRCHMDWEKMNVTS